MTERLTRNQRWEHSLLRVGAHLTHNVIVVLLVQVRNLGQSDLVATVLVLILFQVVPSPSDDVSSVLMPAVGHAVSGHTHKIR